MEHQLTSTQDFCRDCPNCRAYLLTKEGVEIGSCLVVCSACGFVLQRSDSSSGQHAVEAGLILSAPQGDSLKTEHRQ
jgi:hypothetical protein